MPPATLRDITGEAGVSVTTVFQALKEVGFRIPGEIPPVGYDDVEFAPFLEIPLATIRVPKYRLGQRAMELLIKRIEGRVQGPQSAISETQLIR